MILGVRYTMSSYRNQNLRRTSDGCAGSPPARLLAAQPAASAAGARHDDTAAPQGAGAVVLAHSSGTRRPSPIPAELTLGFRPAENGHLPVGTRVLRQSPAPRGARRRRRQPTPCRPGLAKLSGLTPAQIRGLALYDVLAKPSSKGCFPMATWWRRARSPASSARARASARSRRRRSRSRAAGRALPACASRKRPGVKSCRKSTGASRGSTGSSSCRCRARRSFATPWTTPSPESRSRPRPAGASPTPSALVRARRAARPGGDAVIPFNLGNVLDALGRPKDAEIAYRRGDRARSKSRRDAWFNLGLIQEKSGRLEVAVASNYSAIAAEPAYVAAQHNAGLLLMRLRRWSPERAAALRGQDLAAAAGQRRGGRGAPPRPALPAGAQRRGEVTTALRPSATTGRARPQLRPSARGPAP